MASQRKVVLAVVQQKWYSDPQEHANTLRKHVLQAASQGAQLVLLQELTLNRYFGDKEQGDAQVLALAEEMQTGPTSILCSALAKEAQVFLIGSIFEKFESHLYNTALIFDTNGALHGFTRKLHIPSGAGYNETFFFENGDSEFPIHDLGFIKIAVPTCYDQWFPEMARICALKGAELILYPTAIGSEPNFPQFDSSKAWQSVQIGHAIANGVFLAAANRTGNEGLLTFYGTSFVCAPTGEVLAQASRNDDQVLVVTLDFAVFEFWRGLFPLLQQRQPKRYNKICE